MKQIQTRDQLPLALNELGLVGYGVEIGVQRGEYSKLLLEKWNGTKLYLVDAWRQFGNERETFDNPDPNGQLENFAATFKASYFHYDKAVIIKELSVEAAKLFPDQFFDFIYIDAAHDVDNVFKDLTAWYPKIKTGGIFAGHDYFDGFVHMNNKTTKADFYLENKVKSVVDAFFEKMTVPVSSTEVDLFPSWYIRK
jgi:hypothetical protein